MHLCTVFLQHAKGLQFDHAVPTANDNAQQDVFKAATHATATAHEPVSDLKASVPMLDSQGCSTNKPRTGSTTSPFSCGSRAVPDLSVSLSVCLSVCLFICLSVFLSCSSLPQSRDSLLCPLFKDTSGQVMQVWRPGRAPTT